LGFEAYITINTIPMAANHHVANPFHGVIIHVSLRGHSNFTPHHGQNLNLASLGYSAHP